MGQLGEASKFIETTLANFIPVLIDFLARLIGLGNVSERVKKIIMRMRKPVDDLIAKIIRFIKGKLKGLGKGKKGKEDKERNNKDKTQDEKQNNSLLNNIKARYENKSEETHTLRFVKENGKYHLKRFSSNPTLVLGWLRSKITETTNDPNLGQTQKTAKIQKIRDAQAIAREVRDFSYPDPNSRATNKNKG